MQYKTYLYTFLRKLWLTDLIQLLQQSSKSILNFQHHCGINYLMSFLNKSHGKRTEKGGNWMTLKTPYQPNTVTWTHNVWWWSPWMAPKFRYALKMQNKHLNRREKASWMLGSVRINRVSTYETFSQHLLEMSIPLLQRLHLWFFPHRQHNPSFIIPFSMPFLISCRQGTRFTTVGTLLGNVTE